MPSKSVDSFETRRPLQDGVHYYSLPAFESKSGIGLGKIPYSIRVLLENLLRMEDGRLVTKDDVESLARWTPTNQPEKEIPFIASRVLATRFHGVPVVVDLAAMRDAAQSFGVDPETINPLFPVDLVIDHSVQVDRFGSPDAFQKNAALEYARNGERYAFLNGAKSPAQFPHGSPRHGDCPPGQLGIFGVGRGRDTGRAGPWPTLTR
jgi:aconitate hydratase